MERISDPRLRDLVKKTNVYPDAECDKDYYPGTPSIVEVVAGSGQKLSTKVVHPRGSYKNPMADGELEEKFRDLTKRYLTPHQMDDTLKTVWALDKLQDISKLVSGIVVKER